VSEAPTTGRAIRAAIATAAMEAVKIRAPGNVELLALDNDLDLTQIDFLVPTADEGVDVLEILPSLDRLAVVQLLSAGTDWIEDRMPPQATLCSARGARDGNVAEWILGALLGATTGLLECARLQTWTVRRLTDLGSWTVLVVGMGSIGRALQLRLEPLGTNVVGVASHARDDLHGIDELPQLLPAADAVVVLTPLNESTHGLIGAAELAAMSDGALLVNAARGPVVDTDALVPEVQSGRLHAVLDVTDPEPLPDGHPLFALPNVLISPHVGGRTSAMLPRMARLIGDQVDLMQRGEDPINVVLPA
jgi:phosphoglycerate dehydrogenase-like enzyme